MDYILNDISAVLKSRIDSIPDEAIVYEYGRLKSISDGVIHIEGLSSCRYGELIEFHGGIFAMAMDLSESGVGAVLLNGLNELSIGQFARSTGRVIEVPVGDQLLGRVINPIGMALDGKPLQSGHLVPVERPAPTINDRQNINTALETGLLVVDSMIPVGRGQRELIIGDRQTGKTTLAIDAIINQRGKNVICVYVAIGQKASTIARIRDTLSEARAMDYSVILAASAADCAAMQYIAPYAGCSIAEEFMKQGKDVLIVYDDLSKHAVAYRAMSLLLKRPPGREAYPGDVFYLHSRLLERAARMKDELGGGSLTALPIVETMDGDISAYIPTNIISITDGQVFLSTELFNSGIRPAVNVGLSVSRVGRAAQRGAMRAVSGKLRLMLAQYREMQVFTQFGADVDLSTRRLLDYGSRLTEILKQRKNSPYTLSEQVSLLVCPEYTGETPLSKVRTFTQGMIKYLRSRKSDLMERIDKTGELSEEDRTEITQAIVSYSALVIEKENADANAK